MLLLFNGNGAAVRKLLVAKRSYRKLPSKKTADQLDSGSTDRRSQTVQGAGRPAPTRCRQPENAPGTPTAAIRAPQLPIVGGWRFPIFRSVLHAPSGAGPHARANPAQTYIGENGIRMK
jgi:hypothetical protein